MGVTEVTECRGSEEKEGEKELPRGSARNSVLLGYRMSG